MTEIQAGYSTGWAQVTVLGEDGDCYLYPGWQPEAGFVIACYLFNEEQQDPYSMVEYMLGNRGNFEVRHVWATRVERDVVDEDGYEDTVAFYELVPEGTPDALKYTAFLDTIRYALP